MSPTPIPPPPPSAHRRALLVWLAVYPTITLALALLGPVIGDLPLPLQTLIVTLLAVPLISYLVLPLLARMDARLSRARSAPEPNGGFVNTP